MAAASVVLHRRVAHVNSFNVGRCAAENEPAYMNNADARLLLKCEPDETG